MKLAFCTMRFIYRDCALNWKLFASHLVAEQANPKEQAVTTACDCWAQQESCLFATLYIYHHDPTGLTAILTHIYWHTFKGSALHLHLPLSVSYPGSQGSNPHFHSSRQFVNDMAMIQRTRKSDSGKNSSPTVAKWKCQRQRQLL